MCVASSNWVDCQYNLSTCVKRFFSRQCVAIWSNMICAPATVEACFEQISSWMADLFRSLFFTSMVGTRKKWIKQQREWSNVSCIADPSLIRSMNMAQSLHRWSINIHSLAIQIQSYGSIWLTLSCVWQAHGCTTMFSGKLVSLCSLLS